MKKFTRWLYRQTKSFFVDAGELLSLVNPFRRKRSYSHVTGSLQKRKRSWFRYVITLPQTIAYDFYSVLFYWRIKSRETFQSKKKSRRWMYATFVLAALFAGGCYFYFPSEKVLSEEARITFNDAFARGDDAVAEKIGRPLLDEKSNDPPELRFKYAQLLARQNHNEDAEKLIKQLAPDSKPGYPPAHVVRATRCLTTIASDKPSDSLNSLRWHLSCAGDENPGTVEWYWFVYYRTVRQLQTGIVHLEKASRFNRDLLIPLCDAYREVGNIPSLNRTLEEAYSTFKVQTEKLPTDETAVVKFVTIAVQTGRFEEAKSLLEARIKANSETKLKPLLGQVLVRQFDTEFNESPRKTCIECLKKALEVDPTNDAALNRISQFHGTRFDQTLKDEAKTILESLIANGNVRAANHFALGTFHLVEGDTELAMKHLDKSVELDEYSPSACNNLAWLLADTNQNLDRALELAKRAVESKPDFLPFRDTLATVYMKRDELDKALLEFQRVLEGPGDHRSVHQNLAVIYTKLGNDRFADLHRKKLSGQEKPNGM